MNNLKLITVGFQIKTIYSIILFSLVMMVISENKVKAQQVQGSSSISFENVSYGNHPNQLINFRKAKVDKPAPLVVFIHGGGFTGGSHDKVNENAIQQYLDEGIHHVNFNSNGREAQT
ncbi:hypothetical protein OAM03_03390 [Verrucomicrobia bacterium]|nr:hypothetical protein [Verrucomicrobiota bacterium]